MIGLDTNVLNVGGLSDDEHLEVTASSAKRKADAELSHSPPRPR